MKSAGYWSFDQRHPKTAGPMNLKTLLNRWIDRADDTIVAVKSQAEYWRITRSSRDRREAA